MTAARPSDQRAGSANLVVCLLLVLLTVVTNQSAVHWRENLADSHLFAYYGWCVANGAVPYVNIWDNKPPGIWWVNAIGFALFGEGLAAEVLLCSAALTAALAAFIGIARCAYHASLLPLACLLGCTLLAHLTWEGGANRTETFVVTCETLAIFCYLRWQRCRHTLWLVLAGFAAGCAPLFKQSGLAAALACTLHLLGIQLGAFRRRHRSGGESGKQSRRHPDLGCWLAAASGFLLPAVLAAGVLAAQGALDDACFAVGIFNRAYFEIADASWTRIDHALRIYAEILHPLAGLFVLAAVGACLGLWNAGRGRSAASAHGLVALFWLWFALAAYFACVGPGRRGHHFLPALAPLALLALYPLELLSQPEGLWAALLRRPSRAGVLAVLGYFLCVLAESHFSQAARCWHQKTSWWSFSYRNSPGYLLQADRIRELTSRHDRIYVWGWSPGTYRYAYRLPASRFATLEKVGQLRGRADWILDAVCQDLRRFPARALVISPTDLTGVEAHPDHPFTQWLNSSYADLGPVGGMHLLLLRPGTVGHAPGSGGGT